MRKFGILGHPLGHSLSPQIHTALFVLATHFVIATGVQKGIERSAKVLMPLLFVILIVLSIHSLLMPGGAS